MLRAQECWHIYEMLSYACDRYIFSSDDPFRAVGYRQADLLEIVLEKLFYNGYDEKTVKTAVFLTLDSNCDRETYRFELQYVLSEFFKVPDAVGLALVQCDAFRTEYDSFQESKVMFKYGNQSGNYRKETHCNYAVEMYLLLKLKLYEYDEGISYFLKNYSDKPSIKIYHLLGILEVDGLNDYWIREYEKAVKKRIVVHDSLKQKYERLMAEKA